jgi:hypothetical protein
MIETADIKTQDFKTTNAHTLEGQNNNKEQRSPTHRSTRRLHHRTFRHELRKPEICNFNRVVIWRIWVIRRVKKILRLCHKKQNINTKIGKTVRFSQRSQPAKLATKNKTTSIETLRSRWVMPML